MPDIETIIDLPHLPPRPEDGHKGLFGRVLVVGGHEQMLGAPVLAATAALRAGAGLVQIALPQSLLPATLSITPELIGLARPASGSAKLIEAAKMADALVIGPGLGRSADAAAQLAALLRLDKPTLLDADALNILAAGKRWPKSIRSRLVLTPHPGEMTRLAHLIGRDRTPADEPGRIAVATAAAKAFNATVVLKGHRTVITDSHRLYVNTTGDSTLSKAGSGDVLSGIIGCFLAQSMPPLEAAIAGTWLHGRAGEIAGARLGRRCALARDVIDALPQAIGEYEAIGGGSVSASLNQGGR